MFKWQEEVDHLDIPANRVLRLHRSLNEVQIALPGVPSQEATAYVCAFSAKAGLTVTIAMHLKSSQRIAFFFHRNADSGRSAKDLMSEALDYAESMGFSLADTDYHLASESRREEMWAECPLSKRLLKSETDEILEELDELPEEPAVEGDEEPAVEVPDEIIEEVIEEIEEAYDEIELAVAEESSTENQVPNPLPNDAATTPFSPTATPAAENSLAEHLGRLLASF